MAADHHSRRGSSSRGEAALALRERQERSATLRCQTTPSSQRARIGAPQNVRRSRRYTELLSQALHATSPPPLWHPFAMESLHCIRLLIPLCYPSSYSSLHGIPRSAVSPHAGTPSVLCYVLHCECEMRHAHITQTQVNIASGASVEVTLAAHRWGMHASWSSAQSKPRPPSVPLSSPVVATAWTARVGATLGAREANREWVESSRSCPPLSLSECHKHITRTHRDCCALSRTRCHWCCDHVPMALLLYRSKNSKVRRAFITCPSYLATGLPANTQQLQAMPMCSV